MSEQQWLHNYFENFKKALTRQDLFAPIIELKDIILKTHAAGKKVILVGNGGSAAICSHIAVDFTKTAGIRAVNFNEADLITCYGNDYGYENWVVEALKSYADDGDIVILISSSGKSLNMVNAGKYASGRGLKLVTFTGFAKDNSLKSLGELNFWVDSQIYNLVENTHMFWLSAVCDLLIEANKKVPTLK